MRLPAVRLPPRYSAQPSNKDLAAKLVERPVEATAAWGTEAAPEHGYTAATLHMAVQNVSVSPGTDHRVGS